MKFSIAVMSSSSASSETYAVMETSLSTDFTMLSMTVAPTRNTPMMNSDKKMVMMDPSVVDKLRAKPWMDCLRK